MERILLDPSYRLCLLYLTGCTALPPKMRPPLRRGCPRPLRPILCCPPWMSLTLRQCRCCLDPFMALPCGRAARLPVFLHPCRPRIPLCIPSLPELVSIPPPIDGPSCPRCCPHSPLRCIGSQTPASGVERPTHYAPNLLGRCLVETSVLYPSSAWRACFSRQES